MYQVLQVIASIVHLDDCTCRLVNFLCSNCLNGASLRDSLGDESTKETWTTTYCKLESTPPCFHCFSKWSVVSGHWLFSLVFFSFNFFFRRPARSPLQGHPFFIVDSRVARYEVRANASGQRTSHLGFAQRLIG